MNDHLVNIQDLHFSRGKHKVFDGVNITIPQGKITTIMGPSGSGKTTSLKLIGAQLQPESGRIIFNGQNVHELSRSALYEARHQMGMLFQSGALFTNLSVYDNVAFPLREHTNLNESLIRNMVLMKLEAVGLRGVAELMPAEMSGGMARRVALARAIALDPSMIMYDEPFTGQDPISMGVLLQLIKRLNQDLGLTSIVVSHDVEEAASISDYIYVISEGKVLAQGTPAELRKDEIPEVKQFWHGLPDGPVPFHYPAPSFKEELREARE